MVEEIEVTSARRRRNIPLPSRVQMRFRGLEEPILEMTEEDVEDRRRRLEGVRRRLTRKPQAEEPAHGGAWAPACPAVQRLRDCLHRPHALLRADGWSDERTELEDAA